MALAGVLPHRRQGGLALAMALAGVLPQNGAEFRLRVLYQ